MKKRILTGLTTFVFVLATTHIALATDYDVELVVSEGKKSKETDAVLKINEENFEVIVEKKKFKEHDKTFDFSNIKSADYSYSKKPMLSTGGAIAAAVIVGLLVLPFLFIKKKNHWLTVQTEDEFAVMKLDKSNYRAIIAEFETHDIEVKRVEEEKKKKKDDK